MKPPVLSTASPPSSRLWFSLWIPGLLTVLFSLAGLAPRTVSAPATAPRALLIGGGPNRRNNQVGIESNVRYVSRLLPAGTKQTILFADGNPNRATVKYEEETRPAPSGSQPLGERAFSLLIEEEQGAIKYRPPRIPHIDGPCQRSSIVGAFNDLKTELSSDSSRLALLYFTGHGSPGEDQRELNTGYDLWGDDDTLSVRHLAAEIRKLPPSVPVTLIMVQCFSGGFGNVLFEGGNPDGAIISRDLAGFFAATSDRMSSGCTPALNESDYQDFTSYFFAALSGKDRVGRAVTGADYNRDGRVGMNEAFAYTLVADTSIDVPTCTSDVFLRRFVKTPAAESMKTSYTDLKIWATPSQLAALEGLSQKLNLSGEERLDSAYREMSAGYAQATPVTNRAAYRKFEPLQDRYWKVLLERFPGLQSTDPRRYNAARAEAVGYLETQARAGKLKDLFDAEDALSFDDEPGYSLRETRLLRFVRLGNSIALAHQLQSKNDPALLARWKRLVVAEARTPF